jgi:MoaA/NifB/PqqE/SkfB family radical SAM enzyme
MKYKTIFNIATSIDPRDLGVYALNSGRYLFSRLQKNWKPQSLSVEVTYWCNLRCKGCYISDEIKTEKPVIEKHLLESIVEQAEEEKVPFIGFAGGEPLAPLSRGRIFETLSEHPRTLFFVYTNGDFIKDLDKELVSYHNLAYMISVDGLNDNHDLVRGKGSFKRVTGAFKKLKERKKIYGASVTVREHSYDELVSEEFFKYLAENGVKLVRMRTLKSKNEEQTQQSSERIFEKTNQYAERYGLLLSWGGLDEQSSNLPAKDLLVGMDGTLRARRFASEESLGNLKTKSLRAIINRVNSVSML